MVVITKEITSGVKLLKVGAIAFYCLPSDAKQILKIDPSNDETTLVEEQYDDAEKLCNGFARDNFIYAIPSLTNKCFKKIGTSELVGDDFEDDSWKWMSGAVTDDGCLYCFPCDYNRI